MELVSELPRRQKSMFEQNIALQRVGVRTLVIWYSSILFGDMVWLLLRTESEMRQEDFDCRRTEQKQGICSEKNSQKI